MAESLFDNRYRYDYIYPRGRSGETLRALDSQSNNRKVVIKRPALNDAPPIRAGQEVSINNERRALNRLAGHAVLTELLGEGQFFVGGMPHQYIVMERAEGLIIGDEVVRLNASGERLPELEMLVIVEQLLDLLQAAHSKDIVYNDVDAKHLFWKRDEYRLKVIDWGNAVFLEGDEVTQQGISRQTDVYQVGELLYFIVTGGRRAEVPRNAPDDFHMDFGDDVRRVHSRLQEIISKALHPSTRQRYSSITALRGDLTKYRQPIEVQRNTTVATVADKLKRGDLSMSELRTLRSMIEPTLLQDPGYPPAVEAHTTIVDKLRDLAVEGDLDAVRIYMRSSNWDKAAELLRELRDKAGTRTGGLMDLLLDVCVILTDTDINPVPDVIKQAIEQMFDNQAPAAAAILLTDAANDRARTLQWQIAERISSHIPEVLLLRPNLYRINTALRQAAIDGYAPDEPRAILAEVDKTLDDIAAASLELASLRDGYRSVVDQLSALNPLLQTFAAQHQLPNRRVPVNSLERALNAAMALADSMHIIGKQAASSPRDAQHALEVSRAIDPTNPVWDDLDDLLQRLYERLQTSQTYVPAADGSDLESWLETSHEKLLPFQERLFDEMLVNMAKGVQHALKSWRAYQDVILTGNRDKTITALEQAARGVQTISPALSTWFNQLKTVVDGANFIERHALPGGLGRALADGWAAFDRGRLQDAERLGQQAYETARSETGRHAASRLQDISRNTRDWVERNGVASASRTEGMLTTIESLFTPEELTLRQNFEAQMPSIETYLKAMSKGLVASLERSSTAGLRILFFYYILAGTLDVHEGRLDDGEFWRDAAVKTMPELGSKHPATRTLEEYISRRRDLIAAEALFVQINGKHALPHLAEMRRRLEDNAQARLLASGIQSLRDLEVALRDWESGEFRSAGLKMDEAVKGISEVEQTTGMKLEGYRAWVMDLMEAVARLAVQSRDMRKVLEQKPDKPEATVERILHNQVTVTEQMLGTDYAATLKQWRDTYDQFAKILMSEKRRSQRLEQLNELFRALFIDRHPAYPLYRHWYAVLEAQSEFASPTQDATPVEEDDIPEIIYRRSPEDDFEDEAPVTSGNSRRMFIIGGAVIGVVLLVIIGFAMFNRGNATIDVTLTDAPLVDTTATAEALAAAITTEPTEEVSPLPTSTTRPTTAVPTVFNTATLLPSATNERAITIPPTETRTPTDAPTNTNTPVTPSATPTATYTPTITPTPVPPTRTPLPEGGLTGRQDLIPLFIRTADLPFNPEVFSRNEIGYRFGIGSATSGDVIRLVPPFDLIEDSFGNNAANRIRSVEVTMKLDTFNPNVIDAGEVVFYGIGLESVSDGNNVGIQLEVVNDNVINLMEVSNNSTTFLRQRSISSIYDLVRLRIDRDSVTGSVLLYLNDEQIGTAIEFIPPDAAVLPVLFVKDGGVVVSVVNWRVTLR
jgi:hypothetical protein